MLYVIVIYFVQMHCCGPSTAKSDDIMHTCTASRCEIIQIMHWTPSYCIQHHPHVLYVTENESTSERKNGIIIDIEWVRHENPSFAGVKCCEQRIWCQRRKSGRQHALNDCGQWMTSCSVTHKQHQTPICVTRSFINNWTSSSYF